MWAGVHRALVEQKDDHTGALSFRLLSQTDVISFLGAHMDNPSLARIFSKPYAQRRHKIESLSSVTCLTPHNVHAIRIEELRLCNPLGRGPLEPELVTISTKETALEGMRCLPCVF